MISKGDSVKFTLPLSELLGGRPPMPGMDTTLNITYTMTVRDIMDRQSYEAFQMKLIEEHAAKQVLKDVAAIDAFLSEKGVQALKTESGLRYVITQAGNGATCQPGQTASVNYGGYTLEGVYFDTNVKETAEAKGLYNPGATYAPYDVTIDQSQVIKGWHEALKLMSKGTKATFYIPSPLAYGAQQRGEVILPNTILVFDMEIVDVK
jgi:FKBP-type peptidyl-prolyl cis-trans isomerase